MNDLKAASIPTWISYRAAAALAAMFLVGVLLAWWTVLRADRQMRDELLLQARLVERAVYGHRVKALTGTKADLEKQNYLQIKEQLSNVRQANDKCRFVYLMGRRADGTVFLYVDSEPETSKDYSAPGQLYEEASEDLRRVFDTGMGIVEGPLTDRWGRWVSALVPVMDPGAGQLIGVLGMDVDGRTWWRDVAAHALFPIGMTIALMVLLALWLIAVRSRAELRESEKQFRFLADSTPTAVLLYQDDRYIYTNKAAESISGYSAKELADIHFWDLVHPDYKAIIRERGRRRHEGEKATNRYELRILTKEGIEKWVDLTAASTLAGGRPAGILSIVDITERKQAEDRIIASEKRFRDLNDIQGLLLQPHHIDHKLKLVTDAVVRILGADFARIWMIKPGDRCTSGCMHAKTSEGVHVCRFRDRCLHLMASSGRYTHIDGRDHGRVPFGAYKIGKIASGEEAKFLTNDVTNEPRVHRRPWAEELGLKSFAGYRLIDAAGTPLGVLALFSKRAITADDDLLLQGIADATSQVVQTAIAEAALRDSERKYRLLTEKMSDIVWIADMNLRTVYISPSAKTLLGYAWEEQIPLTAEEQMTPDSLAVAYETLARELAIEEQGQGDPDRKVNLVLEYYHKDGSIRWMDTTVSALRDDQGVLTGLHGVSRDITARKRLEEELFLMQFAMDRAPESILLVGDQGNLEYANYAACSSMGYTRQELLGMKVFEIDPDFPLEEWEQHKINLKRVGKMVFEGRHRAKDGWLFPVEVTTNYCEYKGRFLGIAFDRDITEQKRAENALRSSEQRYRTIFESTATSNIIVAEDSTIIMANENFARLCGYTKQELEGEMSWTVFIHKDDLEKMKAHHTMRRGDHGYAPSSFEFRAIRRNGEILNLFASVAIIPETKESVVSIVDLTETKRLETQLIQSQKMESIGRLAGGVAHDFNNMLSVIIGNTEIAMSRVMPPDPVYKSLQDILNAGMRSADLTRQLLAFARRQTVSPKVLDLNDTVTGMLKMLRRLIGEDIDLGWHPGPNLWKVKIDPSQVDQLLANLTVNARDAIAKTGSISIETSNGMCDESYCTDRPDCVPGEYVILAVNDDGCGMDKETQANIFEPFFTTKKEGQGTGLGLATVYGIVRQNRGFINVYSEPGHGTTFRIHIPRHWDENMEIRDEAPERVVKGGTETILIVEDEETVLTLVKSMLEMLGYKVLTARGADQALQLVRGYPDDIDLALSDVVMPDMNGKQLLERMTAIRTGLKCLYMSGYTEDAIARQGVLEEGIKFISKPFSL